LILTEIAKKTSRDNLPPGSVGITPLELARELSISLMLAKQRLLAAEQAKRLCRDETVEGLQFFPNFFLAG
jgi:hypothetical protein